MIDLRIWRTGLAVASLALVVAMFSLQQPPKALEASTAPDSFEGDSAAVLARDMAEQFPDPRPGSEADEGMATFVQDRFEAIPSAELAEQRFEGSFDGEDVDLRNLILTLPGRSERQVALIAPRDVAEGSGAATSTAATAILLQIAEGFSGTSHDLTLVFVSTDGSSIGAEGARRFLDGYTDRDMLNAAVVLSQPGAAEREPPFLIPWSTGDQNTSSALAETANLTVSDEVGQPAGDDGPVRDVMRLALPSGLGEQGPLVEGGLDAVRISSAGELPLPPERDTPDQVDGNSIDDFGRAALSLILTLDSFGSELEHGPNAYIGVAGNLMPGWALAMLALALLVPVAVTAGLAIAGAAHTPTQAAKAVGWAAVRAGPFVIALVACYLLAFTGVIPSPPFPFDPAAEGLGTGGTIGVVVCLLVFGAAAFLLRPLLAPPSRLAECAAAAALALACLTALVLWFVNPYLTLLVAIGLQAWVPAAAGLGGRLGAAGLVALGVLPGLALLVDLSSRFDAGAGVVWDVLLMFTGGQIPGSEALLLCLLAGCGIATIAAAGGAASADEDQLKLAALVERGRRLEEKRTEGRQKKSKRKRRDEEREERRERARAAAEEAVPPPDMAPSEGSPQEPGGGDPRMWSKPPASHPSPSAPRIDTPSPGTIRPI